VTAPPAPVVVVGAGLAGLACARTLQEAGVPVVLLEASDDVGGRVRTDHVDGFRIDRGFQVFFTAYPEAEALLDYGALRLRRFWPAALVRANGAFHLLADPLRLPSRALQALRAPVGSIADKLRVLRLRQRALMLTFREIFAAPERPIREELDALGFSPAFVQRFFRPFLGGIFLDPALGTSSRLLYYVYRMLSEGDTAVPADGMGAIPRQLASRLPGGGVRLRTRVRAVERSGDAAVGVRLDDATIVTGRAVVVATDAPSAAELLGEAPRVVPRGVTCVYFAAHRSPTGAPVLVLDGEADGPVLNLAVMSEVSPGCAPAGQQLVAAVVMGVPDSADTDLERDVRRQLRGWYGPDVDAWRHLRTYRIAWAQFDQSPGTVQAGRPVRRGAGLYVCGDHVESASINGAMAAGRRAADAVLEDCR
jgi:phytoene dehydrogenase-like protein